MCNCLFCKEKYDHDIINTTTKLKKNNIISPYAVVETMLKTVYNESKKTHFPEFYQKMIDDVESTNDQYLPCFFKYKIMPSFLQIEWSNPDILRHTAVKNLELESIIVEFYYHTKSDIHNKNDILECLLSLPMTFLLKYSDYKCHGSIMLIKLNFDMFFNKKLKSSNKSFYNLIIKDDHKMITKANIYIDCKNEMLPEHITLLKPEPESEKKLLNILGKIYHCVGYDNIISTYFKVYATDLNHIFDNFKEKTIVNKSLKAVGMYVEFFDEINDDDNIIDSNVNKIKTFKLFCDDKEILIYNELKLKYKCKYLSTKLLYIPFFEKGFVNMNKCKILIESHFKCNSTVGIHLIATNNFYSI